ncbi:MAG: hypothetical protein HY917_00700 [Candidatus Diapherotrites archaeon]|nr:hypothetical protein [Candidatus Diapherotrites archaeon]
MGKDAISAYAFEFKWKKLSYANGRRILKNLETKTGYLNKKRGPLKFGIVARQIENKQKLRSEGFLAYDLNDF